MHTNRAFIFGGPSIFNVSFTLTRDFMVSSLVDKEMMVSMSVFLGRRPFGK